MRDNTSGLLGNSSGPYHLLLLYYLGSPVANPMQTLSDNSSISGHPAENSAPWTVKLCFSLPVLANILTRFPILSPDIWMMSRGCQDSGFWCNKHGLSLDVTHLQSWFHSLICKHSKVLYSILPIFVSPLLNSEKGTLLRLIFTVWIQLSKSPLSLYDELASSFFLKSDRLQIWILKLSTEYK